MTHKLLHAWRRMFSLAVLMMPVILLAFLIFVLLSSVNHADAVSEPGGQTMAAEPSSSRDLKLRVGDRVTVTFFEKLAVDQNAKWATAARSRRPLQNFYQRTELSGTFAVESDGNIVIPLLGPVPVVDRTLRDFEGDVGKIFEERIGQFGFVNVSVQHRDISVLGPVKRPGTFSYARGMTVWHAVALAGGFDRMSVDMSRLMQAIGEAEKQQRYFQIARKLWARSAVLKAESTNQEIQIPPRLVELTGLPEAKALVDEEREVRRLFVEGIRGQLSALDASKQTAMAELERKKALVTEIEKAIPLQEQRAADMMGLASRKSVSTTLRINAEASLSAAKERHITALIAVEEAESRLGQLAHDRTKLENESKLALSQEIIKIHQEIDEAEVALKSSASSLDAMRAATISGDDKENDGVIFDVVRKSGLQTSVDNVPGTFELEPGDLVRVRIPKSKSGVAAAPAASQ